MTGELPQNPLVRNPGESRIHEGWSWAPLSALAQYVNGRAFKPTDWSATGLPIIRIAQITDPSAVPNFYDGVDVDPRHLVDSDDLLFSWSATLAVVRWTRGPAILNQHIFKVIERPGTDRDFLRHLLTSSIPALAEESHGSTMKHIRKGVLDTFRVAVPPLAEQRKIAAILSSVDNAIEASKAVIDQLQVVKKAMMAELLTRGLPGRHTQSDASPIGSLPRGWAATRLGDLAQVAYGLTVNASRRNSEATRPYLTVANVQGDGFDLAQVKQIGCLPGDERYELRRGDVLVIEGNANPDRLGRAFFWGAQVPGALHQNHLIRVRVLDERVEARWLALALNGERARQQVADCAKTSSGLHTINSKVVADLIVPVPPVAEQRDLIRIFDALRDRETAEIGVLAELRGAKSALTSVLLTGGVRIKLDASAQHPASTGHEVQSNA